MTRLHPFDHVFAPLAERFPEVRAEAASARKDTADRAQFAALSTLQRILADLEDPAAIEETPEAAEAYLAVLHAAYRYWDAGEPTIDVARERLAPLLDRPVPPTDAAQPALYARLPERWIWTQVTPDAPHEPIDGLFLIPGAHGREVTVLAVLGLRADRPGFGEITVHATPDEARAAFDELRTPPFTPVLDGGTAAGLRSVVTRAELLALALLAVAAGVTE